MVSEAPGPLTDDIAMVTEKPVISHRSSQSKNNPVKVPKKIHKAEREKVKRDNLNELFLELSNTLEPAHQNNGKASLLSNATRLLRDLLCQVDSLKEENTNLLSESHYVRSEKTELREENSALQAQIEDLKIELQERIHSKYAWKLDHSQTQHETASQLQEDHLVMPVNDHASQPAPVLGPLFVVPLHHQDLPVYHESDTSDSVSKVPSNISKPHARYPSSSDAWPSQILAKQSETTQIAPLTSSGPNS
ncbi:basic helix-loop-helix (bHLH) DNA-binding superfamily protein [Actinidia rufa]|uniref:Basic helix-loop-helix (BHLH) DNA-binding superfamily protein n=1 Tax=Actinidia rufa TaxID=165716 RepID=A0A7J0E925_9ERIC|nr:basic helix-loop-helix (bHLH) DNA-binding superfamily protein [Actinidia rufa]